MAITDEIRLDRGAEPATQLMLDRPITGPIAWRRGDVSAADWRIPVSEAALAELDTLAAAFAEYHGAVDDLAPDPFDWPATIEVMVAVRSRLDHGIGLAVLDRLPVERWGGRATTAVAWLLTNHLAPAIMQKWKGHRIYDVRDTGAKLQYGVRRSTTNLAQEFHTDGSFLGMTPELMGLACLQQAEVGGISRLASLATVHNRLLERRPEVLPRLYRSFWWDRQAEHAPDELPSSRLPIFTWDSERLSARYYDDYIRNGHRLMNAPLAEEDNAALAAMKAIIEEPDNWIEFRLEPGQIEYTNNQLLAHGRTGFRDADGRSERHLLRFWLRSVGGIGLEAETAAIA